MAMNATTLANLIKSNLLADAANTKAVDNAALQAFCDAVAAAVVTHIAAAGAISTVTSCPAGAGTGTGTIA